MANAIRYLSLSGEKAKMDRALIVGLAAAVVANGLCLLSYL